jgi:hypothetical protein
MNMHPISAKVSIRSLLEKYPILFICKNLVDFNEVQLHEATLNIHTHV